MALMEPQNNAFIFVQNHYYTNVMKPEMEFYLELHMRKGLISMEKMGRCLE